MNEQWEVRPDLFGARHVYIKKTGERLTNDRMTGTEGWDGRVHLIAAAPDLLKALIWAEATIAPFSKEPAEKSGINMIRAAIAKTS